MQGFSAKSQIYLKFLWKRLVIGATMRLELRWDPALLSREDRRYNKYLFVFFKYASIWSKKCDFY